MEKSVRTNGPTPTMLANNLQSTPGEKDTCTLPLREGHYYRTFSQWTLNLSDYAMNDRGSDSG